jgi:hypothetical protein
MEVVVATTIKQVESEPESYPPAPSGLSAAAAALDAAMIWQRIEHFIAYRYSARAVVWIAEGGGAWFPPLAPATIATIERWEAGAWVEDASLCASPMGGYVLQAATYRFAGTVGPETPAAPAAVVEAFRRLAEYMAAKPGKAGAAFESVNAGSVSTSVRRDPAWLAMAMQNSGAGDLLRTYRRAA